MKISFGELVGKVPATKEKPDKNKEKQEWYVWTVRKPLRERLTQRLEREPTQEELLTAEKVLCDRLGVMQKLLRRSLTKREIWEIIRTFK